MVRGDGLYEAKPEPGTRLRARLREIDVILEEVRLEPIA